MKRLLTISALTLGITAVASAGSLTVNCSTSSGATDLSPGNNGTINCAEFNSSLGTLSSISLTITGAVLNTGSTLSTITITNNNANTETGKASTDSAFNLDASTPLTGFSFTLNSSSDLFDVIASTGNQTLTSGQKSTFNVNSTGSNTAVDTTVFAPYTGSGTFAISADTLTGLNITFPGGNVTGTQATYDSLTASVTYNYTPVNTSTPEPATMTLFGSALLGIGFFARKRFQK